MRKLSYICTQKTVIVAQLVRASDCGSEGRGFETHHSPKESTLFESVLFYFTIFQKENNLLFSYSSGNFFPFMYSDSLYKHVKMVFFNSF